MRLNGRYGASLRSRAGKIFKPWFVFLELALTAVRAVVVVWFLRMSCVILCADRISACVCAIITSWRIPCCSASLVPGKWVFSLQDRPQNNWWVWSQCRVRLCSCKIPTGENNELCAWWWGVRKQELSGFGQQRRTEESAMCGQGGEGGKQRAKQFFCMSQNKQRYGEFIAVCRL